MALTKPKSKSTRVARSGVTASVPGFVLVKVPGERPAASPRKDWASTLVPRIGKALESAAISREVFFTKSRPTKLPVYAYSVDPSDVTRYVREAADGTRTVGRMVNGRFVRVKAA
jgi:hypothetical protein